MRSKDIKDRESLQLWLEMRPVSDARIIAERAAIRIAVTWFKAMDRGWAGTTEINDRTVSVTDLTVLRSLLSSGVNRQMPNAEFAVSKNSSGPASADATSMAGVAAGDISATYAASAASEAEEAMVDPDAAASKVLAAKAVDNAVRAAARVATGNNHDEESWEPLRVDCQALELDQGLENRPLWDETPDWFADYWQQVRTRWTLPNAPYQFWTRWYDGMIRGDRMPLPLLHDIALIDNAEWEAGPERIAELIAGIEEDFSDTAHFGKTPGLYGAKLGAVRGQIKGLRLIIEAEWRDVCARNHVPESEQASHDQRRELLSRLRELVSELEDITGGTTDQAIGTELVAVESKLPAIVEAAEELADATQKAHPSADIIAIAASTKVLTDNGMPGTVASGIALTEFVINKIAGFLKKKPKHKAP